MKNLEPVWQNKTKTLFAQLESVLFCGGALREKNSISTGQGCFSSEPTPWLGIRLPIKRAEIRLACWEYCWET